MAETQTKQTAIERTKELTDRLESGIQDLLQSEKYKEYLKSMSQFYRYSTRNTLLIHMQVPHATRVASFKQWDKDFNRHVKKGEKSIRIFAPIVKKEMREFDKIDPVTQTPMTDKNGKVITEELESESLRFKLVPVFDVSQTYGEPLPEIVENLTGDVEQYEAFLDTLREVSPLPIEFEQLRENTDGYCRYGDKIGIREGMSEVQTISAVVHEITHAKLHDKHNSAETVKGKSTKMKEVEAESISYVVCQHFGIETSPNSFGYLAEWGSDDMSEFKASLDLIRKEAKGLINAIDERFEQICKDRGIDLSETEPVQATPEATAEAPAVQEQPIEPTFTAETRTENIAGVEFTSTDIISEQPEEVFEITYWLKGTGTDVLHYYNEGDERYGDYETLAHIAPDRSVEFVKTDLSNEIIEKINAYAQTAEIPNMAATVAESEPPKETRPIGDIVLMPLVYNNDGNFERTSKRSKVKIEPPIGKYPVYSREINGSNEPYFYLPTDSGRLVSIYGAGRYGGQMPDTVTEQSIDTYFSQAKAAVDKAMQEPETWVDFNHAAIANRLDEADAHNQPIRESREAVRAEKAQQRQAEDEAKKVQIVERHNSRVDDMEIGLVRGDRIDTTIDNAMNKNPLFTLLERHGVELPLATKGWVNRNLKSVQLEENGACKMWLPKGAKGSHTFGRAMVELKNKIVESLTPEQIQNHPEKANTVEYRNYEKMAELFPKIVSGEYSYMRLESSGFEPLSVEWISDDEISVMHTYEMNGDLMYDPMMTFKIDSDTKTANPTSFEQSMPPLYQVVNEDGSGQSIDGNGRERTLPNLQSSLNSFSSQWFENIGNQGFIPVRAIAEIDGEDKRIEFDKDGNAITPEQTGISENIPTAADEPAEIMPDPAIDVSERDLYGYTSNEVLPLTKDRALELYDQDITVFLLYEDNTEAMAFERSDIDDFEGLFGIERSEWENTPEYAELKAQSSETTKEAKHEKSTIDKFIIYQLKDSEDLRYHRFTPMNQLAADSLNINADNYNQVYAAPLLQGETLEDIFRQFNHAHPHDFTGHSLSISDVVVLERDGVTTAHYVDTLGFTELPSFLENEKQIETAPIPEQLTLGSDNIEDSKAPPPEVETPAISKSIYRETFEYAYEHEEFDLFHADRNLNNDCRNAIDTAINESRYDGNFYKMKEAVKQVVDEYGSERVELLMAKIVQGADWDGRYSRQNKEWAKGFDVPPSMKDIYSNTHPILLDGFLNKVREKPSVLESLKANAEKSRQQSEPKQDNKKTKEMEM